MKFTDAHTIEAVYDKAIAEQQLSETDTAAIFYDTSVLQNRLDLLRNNFPNNTLHAIAIKTNSHPDVLQYIAQQNFGLEAASYEEVQLAIAAGVPNEKIVFDSPVKTRWEIQQCHEQHSGMIVNVNSLAELERYPMDFSGKLGLRINPLVDAKAPSMLNVSKQFSKFGIPITESAALVAACVARPSISGLHFHIGSGIKNFDANIIAAKKVLALADEIHAARKAQNIPNKIEWIDIGGGIDFSLDAQLSAASFVAELSKTNLFNDYKVITEYGKFVHKHAAFVVSDIEYITQHNEARATAFIHVGADMFLRKVYSDLPLEFPHSIIRKAKNTAKKNLHYDITGPLCFSGDYLFRNIELEQISTEDKFVIQSVGANTTSMWSNHCSRKIPKTILF